MSAEQYLTLGTPVIIDEESEYYPGEVAYIIDVATGEDYAYCVSPSNSQIVTNCQWVRKCHVRPIRRRTMNQVGQQPGSSSSPAEDQELTIGAPVVARDNAFFALLPEVGYITEIESAPHGMIGISIDKGGDTDIFIKRSLVELA